MAGSEDNLTRWQIGLSDLIFATACLAVSVRLLLKAETITFGFLIFLGVIYGLVYAGQKQGQKQNTFLYGFAQGTLLLALSILILLLLGSVCRR
jgi:hypothetical protein